MNSTKALVILEGSLFIRKSIHLKMSMYMMTSPVRRNRWREECIGTGTRTFEMKS